MDKNGLILNKFKSQMSEITNKQWNDFLHSAMTTPWGAAGVNSGVVNANIGSNKHPGVITYTSSTAANSGCRLTCNANSILLGGGEKTTFVFKTATVLTGITRRMGFHDASDFNAPVDGVYAKIADGIITGQAVNNSVISTTQTNYTLASDIWYRLKVELNSDGTTATYTLYADDSNTVLWSDTLSTNIPKQVGREVSHSDICTLSGTSATLLGSLDYMDIILPNARRVV